MSASYFVLPFFHEMSLDKKPHVEKSFILDIIENLCSPREILEMHTVLRVSDLYDLKSFWQNLPLHQFGNLSLNDFVSPPTVVDVFIVNQLRKFHGAHSLGLESFSVIFEEFFAIELDKSSKIVREFLNFERERFWWSIVIRYKLFGVGKIDDMDILKCSDDLGCRLRLFLKSNTNTSFGFVSDKLLFIFSTCHNADSVERAIFDMRMQWLNTLCDEFRYLESPFLFIRFVQYWIVCEWKFRNLPIDEDRWLDIIGSEANALLLI